MAVRKWRYCQLHLAIVFRNFKNRFFSKQTFFFEMASRQELEERLGKLTCATLKCRLGELGLVKHGNKEKLIERILNWHDIQSFAQEPVAVPEHLGIPDWPDHGSIKTLRPSDQDSMPDIRKEHVDQYVLFRQALDRSANKDQSAMKRGEKMLPLISAISHVSSNQTDVKYYTGLVKSSHRKKIVYDLKIALNVNGEPLFSHCDCTVGKGPHSTCKHIVGTLLAMASFKTSGELNFLRSCTDQLQTFNQPKKQHSSSPVKAQQLKGPKIAQNEDDPRHPDDIGRSFNRVDLENRTTAFVYFSGMDVSNRYTYSRADLQKAAQDHDYLRNPFLEC